jgi:hypothetical protein
LRAKNFTGAKKLHGKPGPLHHPHTVTHPEESGYQGSLLTFIYNLRLSDANFSMLELKHYYPIPESDRS